MPTIKKHKPKTKPLKQQGASGVKEEALSPLEEAMENPIVINDGQRVEGENVFNSLTLRQKKFCQLYALNTEFMGNGVEAYDEVYDVNHSKPGWYKVAQAAASRLLSNVIVCEYINSLLTTQGFSNENADKQLLYCMNQHRDLGTKKASIDSYNKLKGRITDKIENSLDKKAEDLLKKLLGEK